MNKQTNLKDNTSYLSSIKQCSGDLSPQLVCMGIFQIINATINKLNPNPNPNTLKRHRAPFDLVSCPFITKLMLNVWSFRLFIIFLCHLWWQLLEKHIGLLISFRSLHKQKQIVRQTHTWWPLPPPPPLTSYIRVPMATGQDRSHLNEAFLVHRWGLSIPPLLLFFIVVSRASVSPIANESRSACAELLLRARWDSIEMTSGGWPTWCNHNAARKAFSYPFDNHNKNVRQHAGAYTHKQALTSH